MWSVVIHWVLGSEVSWEVEAKVSPNFCSAGATLPEQIKQSEMAAMCAGLGGYQSKPSYGSRLAAASVGPGAN